MNQQFSQSSYRVMLAGRLFHLTPLSEELLSMLATHCQTIAVNDRNELLSWMNSRLGLAYLFWLMTRGEHPELCWEDVDELILQGDLEYLQQALLKTSLLNSAKDPWKSGSYADVLASYRTQQGTDSCQIL